MTMRFRLKLASAIVVIFALLGSYQVVAKQIVTQQTAAKQTNQQIAVQSRFSPLLIPQAPEGGAHPIGGPALIFSKDANLLLKPLGLELVLHITGKVHPSDKGEVKPGLVNFSGDLANNFATLHHAVAAGEKSGGLAAGIGLSNMTNTPFGHLLVAGLPFGMEPDEFAAWLYQGGGLALQQTLYDEVFDENLIVIPIGITPTQGGGWFPEELPDSMAQLCTKPWLVRWPETGSSIWAKACENVDINARNIRTGTRCGDHTKACPAADNPISFQDQHLGFGGFVFGGLPHKLRLLNQLDAYELNLPYTDVLMMKLSLGLADQPNEQVDLSPIIDKAPYLYGGTWHQTLSYIELIINKQTWLALTPEQREAIQIAARAATLKSWTIGLEKQDQGIRLLAKNGAQFRTWPQPLLNALRIAADEYLDEQADRLSAQGNDRFRRLLDHMRAWQQQHRIYNDFGDLTQGDAGLKE